MVDKSFSENHHQCRGCLSKSSRLRNLFTKRRVEWKPKDSTGRFSTLAKEISYLTRIPMEKVSDTPSGLCDMCYQKLKEACLFIDKLIRSDATLKKKTSWTNPITIETKQLSQSQFENLESHASIDLSNGDEEMNELENRSDSTRVSANCSVKEEILSDCDEQNKSDMANEQIDDIKIEIDDEISGQQNGYESEENSLTDLLHQLQSDDKSSPCIKEEPVDTESDTDIPLDCMLCGKTLKTITGLKAHVVAWHTYDTGDKADKQLILIDLVDSKNNKKQNVIKTNIAGKHLHQLKCKICNKAGFQTMNKLKQHESSHKAMQCFVCKKRFSSYNTMIRHMNTCSMETLDDIIDENIVSTKPKTVGELRRLSTSKSTNQPNETVKCDICNETFTEKFYLHIHNEIHHNTDEMDEKEQELTENIETPKQPNEKESENTEINESTVIDAENEKLLPNAEISSQLAEMKSLTIEPCHANDSSDKLVNYAEIQNESSTVHEEIDTPALIEQASNEKPHSTLEHEDNEENKVTNVNTSDKEIETEKVSSDQEQEETDGKVFHTTNSLKENEMCIIPETRDTNDNDTTVMMFESDISLQESESNDRAPLLGETNIYDGSKSEELSCSEQREDYRENNESTMMVDESMTDNKSINDDEMQNESAEQIHQETSQSPTHPHNTSDVNDQTEMLIDSEIGKAEINSDERQSTNIHDMIEVKNTSESSEDKGLVDTQEATYPNVIQIHPMANSELWNIQNNHITEQMITSVKETPENIMEGDVYGLPEKMFSMDENDGPIFVSSTDRTNMDVNRSNDIGESEMQIE